jgi:hypothetical protein
MAHVLNKVRSCLFTGQGISYVEKSFIQVLMNLRGIGP